jgi:hypothetical protein
MSSSAVMKTIGAVSAVCVEAVLELEAGHSPELDVQHEAARLIVAAEAQEFFRGGERSGGNAVDPEDAGE